MLDTIHVRNLSCKAKLISSYNSKTRTEKKKVVRGRSRWRKFMMVVRKLKYLTYIYFYVYFFIYDDTL